MASDTRNVKLGVCKVFFDGVDLGYTKGGVEVEASSDTKVVTVDQLGNTPVDEIVMGRKVSVKVPLAETTAINLAKIMPGAILTTNGAKATGDIVVSTPADNDTITVNGKVFTWKTAASGADQVTIGGSSAASAQNLQAKLAASTDPRVVQAHYTVAASTVTVTHDDYGTAGNAFTLARSGTGTTVPATLSGGTAVTQMKVSVPTGTGLSLLDTAKELRLHPKRLPDADKSDDFVIPRANTAGALTFAYNFENERVFNTTFMGYPDPTTDELFYLGADA